MENLFNTPLVLDDTRVFNEDEIADTIATTAIPLLSIDSLRAEDGSQTYKPVRQAFTSLSNNLKNILHCLTTRQNLTKFYALPSAKAILVGLGCIMTEEGKSLMTLCLKKNAIGGNYFYEEAEDFIGYDKFILYVSTEFITDPEYNSYYKRLQKAYLEICFLKGVEVRILTSQKIEQNTFANGFEINFSTVQELDYILKNDLKNLLCNPLRSFVNHSFFNPNAISVVPPSVEQVETATDFLREITEIPPAYTAGIDAIISGRSSIGDSGLVGVADGTAYHRQMEAYMATGADIDSANTTGIAGGPPMRDALDRVMAANLATLATDRNTFMDSVLTGHPLTPQEAFSAGEQSEGMSISTEDDTIFDIALPVSGAIEERVQIESPYGNEDIEFEEIPEDAQAPYTRAEGMGEEELENGTHGDLPY